VPTIQGIDSFQHRILPVAINATNGWYSVVNGGGTLPNHGGGGWSFDTSIKRTADHACSAKLVTDGAGTFNIRRTIASTMVVGSVYVLIPSPPSGDIKITNMGLSAGVAQISVKGTTGNIALKVGSGTEVVSSLPLANNVWHRIDWKCDTTGATALLDAKVDGVDASQASLSLASANITNVMLGPNTVDAAGTIYFQDLVWSVTAGDYPLGDHICLGSTINGTGTHNKGAGTWADEAGNTSDAELLNSVDDAWNGTTPELSQTGEDYVVKSAGVTATEYLEFTIEDAAAVASNVWGAQLGCLIAALDKRRASWMRVARPSRRPARSSMLRSRPRRTRHIGRTPPPLPRAAGPPGSMGASSGGGSRTT
jgi:hypothetical protein